MSADNLRHWKALSKTDPKHTKPFQRAGGFRGTAIKPIFMTEMMTEHFGPCGKGWGMDKPEFTTLTVGEEILVYCTVSLWYREQENTAAAQATVYGVGGDKVAVKRSNGVMADDEAFKKAYTDALSNAMKQLGVGADVHMGMFEDAKYVRELEKEFADEPVPAPPKPPTSVPPSDDLKAQAEELKLKILKADNIFELDQLMDDARDMLKKLPEVTYEHLGKLYEKRKNAMETAA